jgi:arginyl-tRNA synthetase
MSSFLDKEASADLKAEIAACAGLEPDKLPDVVLSPVPKEGDYCLHCGRLAGLLKRRPDEIAADFASKINASPHRLIRLAKTKGPYLNLDVDRVAIFKLVIERVESLGDRFGSSTQSTPKRIIVEHTSANPNAPLHIGNLRNVMIGAHLARLQRFCGCTVLEYFFVNDLGGQIGLTALGYHRLCDLPDMKLDHLMGVIYAVMNTLNEAQKRGFRLSEFVQAVKDAPPEPDQVAEDDRMKEVWIARSLSDRYPEVYAKVVALFTDEDNIHQQSAVLNKAYEDREPGAIAIFRKMACDTLTGHQATLDTYGVRHHRFDFESELSWDGTSGALIRIMQLSKYFHAATQSNEKGVPEGAYIDLDGYLTDINAKRGKGGYTAKYPPFYVMRPDGTTLYTLRDVAYSMKKISEADMVLNVICSEQNLPQEKVMLSLKAVGIPNRIQFHMSYELVKLMKHGEVFRMSGRRGVYSLADVLYDDLRHATREMMDARVGKGKVLDEAEKEKVCHTVATASMKYTLLRVSPHVEIAFDVAEAVDPKGNSGAFILYSGTRIQSILNKFEERVRDGRYPPEPPEVDWNILTDDQEWEMLTKYIMPFATLIRDAALPPIPPEPRLPDFGTHVIPQFAFQLARVFASYYGRVKVLSGEPGMYTRVRFCRAVQRVINNALSLFMVEPLGAM